ncbi:CYTH domain-containing protein [Gayadomonas joobiniege]|uniref:CYTH domain-containing protein n=1 Tax=Gayadomonas joobiniege TaxID=1234606 RepID=UPI00035E9DDE|nr:CYTH domain-containing protein [Gayadomonas joobiniege]
MDTEIELKFAVASNDDEEGEPAPVAGLIESLLAPYLQVQGNVQKRLINTYFDTPEQKLRAYDCGLRVRTRDDYVEQTLKTAGSSIGGLHKRPEFNIQINHNTPDLDLFPAEAWPEGVNVAELQAELTPLFTTDFTRTTWRVVLNGSEIEVVYDIGEVAAQNSQQAIHEIEMELIDGDMRELFNLAEQLLDELPLRLSNDSKAARGYRLFLGQTPADKPALGVVDVQPDMDVETAFSQAIQHGLGFWQYHEENYVSQGKIKTLQRVLLGIWLVRHTLWMYRSFIPKKASTEIRKELKWLSSQFDWLDEALHVKQLTSKKGNYRKRIGEDEKLLAYLEKSFESQVQENAVIPLFYSARYNRLILKLMRWIIERGWRCYSEIEEQKLAQNIATVANELNQQSWIKIQKQMPLKKEFELADYIASERPISRGLLTGACVGNLYDSELRENFRSPWLDILQGISDLKTLNLFIYYLENYREDNEAQLRSWGENKIAKLVEIMEQSRQSALKMSPYW